MKKEEMPSHFQSDECLRCCKIFEDRAITNLVVPAPGLFSGFHPPIGMLVCAGCLAEGDAVAAIGFYMTPGSGPVKALELKAPIYSGMKGWNGYAKLARLDNGHWRVGQKRGHVEIWDDRAVQELGDVPRGEFGYTEHYELYGATRLGIFIHTEIERQFVNLRHPVAWTTAR